MKFVKNLQTRHMLNKLRSERRAHYEQAAAYFSAADSETVDQLQTFIKKKDRRAKAAAYVGCSAFLYCLLALLALPFLTIAFKTPPSLGHLLSILAMCAIGIASLFRVWILFAPFSLNVCHALAISEHLTPSALIHLLKNESAYSLERITPAIVEYLSTRQAPKLEEQTMYMKALQKVSRHFFPSGINQNLPLALALARFYAQHGSREAYSFLSLSVMYNPVTEPERQYFEAVTPLVQEMERRFFPSTKEAEQFFKRLPSHYAPDISSEKRLAIHALAYLLPQLDPQQAEFLQGELRSQMLRYLVSDPIKFPFLHLAIIDYIRRAQMLDAISALTHVMFINEKGSDPTNVRAQVYQAAKSTQQELETLAAQKKLAKTLLRAGTPDDSLLRAPTQGMNEESTELLLRKGIEE